MVANDIKIVGKEFGAYPVSITIVGIIAIILLSETEIKEIISKVAILLISFALLLGFNTHYFKWFNRKR